jgi:hypothetical protein
MLLEASKKIKNKKNFQVGFNKGKDFENHYKKLLLLFSPFTTFEMSQRKKYCTWHDVYKINKVSIQIIQKKFVNSFGASIANTKNVDCNEIQTAINKLAIVKYKNKLWMEIFQNYEANDYSRTKIIIYVSKIIISNLHGVKNDIFLEFHVNPKKITPSNFQLIHC